MHVTRASIMTAAAIAAVVLAAPAANARTAFGGNACGLLSAAQLKPVHVSLGCNQKSSANTFGRVTVATWGSIHGAYVMANIYDVNAEYAARAKSVFDTRGTSVGVGDWSSFKGLANGKTVAEIDFGVGHTIVGIAVRTPTKQPLTSSKPVIAIAKTIAVKLR